MKLLLARHPDYLDSASPIIIEEMLELNKSGKKDAVTMMIKMMSDLYENGDQSRYLRGMRGYPFRELKSQSRGGIKGGTRIYLFITEHNEAGIVNCEVKEGNSPSNTKLKTVMEVIKAHKNNQPVFSSRRG